MTDTHHDGVPDDTEQRLRETEARFRIMADAAPVLLWMADTDGLCTFFNQTWLDFTGRTLAEEWGVGWAERVHFEDFQRCMDTYVAAFSRRERFEMEYRLQRFDGEYRWILDRGVARFSPDGTFAGYIGSCVDITERRAMEFELRKAVRVRDDFLSVTSHELRTPLTTMHLQLESLTRALERFPAEHPEYQRVARCSRVALEQTDRLERLVTQLLDVSRLGERRLELQREDFDLASLTREIAERLAPLLPASGCRLDLSLDDPVEGRWDRARVDQVISNLLSNAIKFGVGGPIDVRVHRDHDQSRVVVRDRGIGISPADHDRIFERFERAVSTEHYGGFGLGLWISRRIASAHGGTLEVSSDLGAGATFTLTLPRVGLDADRAVAAGRRSADLAVSDTARHQRVIVGMTPRKA